MVLARHRSRCRRARRAPLMRWAASPGCLRHAWLGRRHQGQRTSPPTARPTSPRPAASAPQGDALASAARPAQKTPDPCCPAGLEAGQGGSESPYARSTAVSTALRYSAAGMPVGGTPRPDLQARPGGGSSPAFPYGSPAVRVWPAPLRRGITVSDWLRGPGGGRGRAEVPPGSIFARSRRKGSVALADRSGAGDWFR
jgi:hypothetical protein